MQGTVVKYLVFLVMLVIFGLWFLLLRPSFLGGPATYVIISGHSMEQTMFSGDLTIVLRRDEYSSGDIIAFRVEEDTELRVARGGIVIHRIIGGNSVEGFVTQGDNNDFIDPVEPTPDEIVGKAVFFIPRLGAVFSYFQDPLRLSIAVGSIFLYTSLAGSILSWKAYNAREQRRKRRERAAQSRAGLASWLSG